MRERNSTKLEPRAEKLRLLSLHHQHRPLRAAGINIHKVCVTRAHAPPQFFKRSRVSAVDQMKRQERTKTKMDKEVSLLIFVKQLKEVFEVCDEDSDMFYVP